MDLLDTPVDTDSIRSRTRDYILEKIIGGVGPVRWGYKVLILDQTTMRIVDASVEMKDITNAGVSDVCFIDKPRLNLAKLDGIYFLAPTEQNVKQVIQDFVLADEPRYKSVHLFFTTRVDENLMKLLSQDRVMARIKTFKEANIEHLVYDCQTFHFDMPKSFYNLYAGTGKQAAEQRSIADKLATVCTTLGEYPIIRYARTNVNCAAIASLLHEQIERYRKADLLKGTGERGFLIILDRTDDLVAPLVHELTYQAMVQDLVKPENDVYVHKYQDANEQEQTQEVILNDNDVLWRQLRTMLLQNARIWAAAAYKKFREQNKVLKSGDLSEQLRSMPKYQALASKFSVHINLIKACSDIYNRNGLERLISLEQEIATGADESGRKVAEPKDLVPMIQQNISKENKMRLLMMYYAANPKSMEAQKRKSLEGNARLTDSEEKLISNWIALKNQSTRGSHSRPNLSDSEWEFPVARYLPTMYDIVNDLAKGTLSTKDYPFFNRDEESEGKALVAAAPISKRQKQHTGWDKKTKPDRRRRVMIFIVGGCTYSEIRVAHVLSAKEFYPDVVVGSTHIFNPERFMKQVAALNSPQGANDPAYVANFIGKDVLEAHQKHNDNDD